MSQIPATQGTAIRAGTVPGTLRPSPTFGQWVEGVWWPQAGPHLKPGPGSSRAKYRAILDRQLVPAFGDSPLAAIDRALVLDWFERYSSTSPGAANLAFKILGSVLRHALDAGVVPADPTRGIRRNSGRKMTRFLSGGERSRLLAALDDCPPRDRVRSLAVKMLLFTGCRSGEIAKLTWDEVGEGVLDLKDSKSGPRRVWLGAEAMAILDDARALNDRRGSSFVFPSPGDPRRPNSRSAIARLWRALRDRAGIPDMRLHDLRHSYATEAVRNGIPLPVVSKLLGHSDIKTTMRYTHASHAEAEAAAERIGWQLARLLDG